ncbi:inositol monophosphatase family protein [Bacillus sp. FJAT-45037]|uniref:inositol monophosphatase family protein n=1 Tax=Bacillus sp. FJAT-45037 TaxID=2011007 RepID=UPI000C2482E9|nr:inositol monophosphatase family protein [Bacillus sp. FJAT-45037]
MSTNWLEIESIATDWIYEAGQKIKETLAGPIDIESKTNPDDLVTEVDRAIEAFFYERIKKQFPEHYFLGEEGIADEEPSLDGTIWIIDPIDGTMNFIHQKQHFAISVGVYHNKIGMIGLIYDVMRDELFHAVKGHGAFLNKQELPPVKERPLHESVIGLNARWLVETKHPYQNPLKAMVRDVRSIRTYGSAALEIAYVASDRLDGYLSVQLSPWDYAAGLVILNEVGCAASNFHGDPLSLSDSGTLLAAKPHLHKEIVSSYVGEEY